MCILSKEEVLFNVIQIAPPHLKDLTTKIKGYFILMDLMDLLGLCSLKWNESLGAAIIFTFLVYETPLLCHGTRRVRHPRVGNTKGSFISWDVLACTGLLDEEVLSLFSRCYCNILV